MATWAIDVQVVDVAEKRLSVTGTRTDGADVRSYTIDVKWDDSLTRQQNGVIMRNCLRAEFDTEIARETAYATIIGTLAADLAAALDAQET